MLLTETVSPETLELIKILQADLIFSDFCLVGGTALSLQIGHRISVDIDFFSREMFDVRETLEYLEQQYGFQMQYTHKNRNDFHAIKSMTYFDDIITQDWPNMVLERNLTIEKS